MDPPSYQRRTQDETSRLAETYTQFGMNCRMRRITHSGVMETIVRHSPALHRWLLISVLLLPQSCGAQTDAPDPGLTKAVTLAVKGEALSGVMAMLQAQTGVQLRVPSSIADQKVTIFVDDKPLIDVIHGLKTLFGYRFSYKAVRDHRIYELWEPESVRRIRSGPTASDYAKSWEETSSKLQSEAQTPLTYSGKALDLERKLYRDCMAEGVPCDSYGDPMSERLTRPALRFCASLPDEAMRAIRSGFSLYFDTESPEEEWTLPRAVAGSIDRLSDYANGEKDEDLSFRGMNVCCTGGEDGDGVHVRVDITLRVFSADEGGVQTYQASTGVGSDARRFRVTHSNPLPQSSAVALSSMVVVTPAELARETGVPVWTGDAHVFEANRSDWLAIIHRKLGTQVISDHYSGCMTVCAITSDERPWWENPMGHTVKETLARHFSDAYLGADSDFIYMRTVDPFAQDPSETPNRLLRPWQARFARDGWLGLQELAQIASMDVRRSGAVASGSLNLHLAYPDSRLPHPTRELRLYAALSPRQREEAFAGGTDVAGFTADQLRTLRDVVGDSEEEQDDIRSQMRIGMYKDGRRVDRPEQNLGVCQKHGPRATSVRIVKPSTGKDRWLLRGLFLSLETEWNASAEEVWRMVRKERPDATKSALIRRRSHVYQMIFTYSDGTTTDGEFRVEERTPFLSLTEGVK